MPNFKLLVMSVCVLSFFSLTSSVYAEKVFYEYDDFGRMKSASHDDGYNLSQIAYQYDNVGNFLNENIMKQGNLNPQLTASPQSANFETIYSGSTVNKIVTVTNCPCQTLSQLNS
jgi:hypothetical protein